MMRDAVGSSTVASMGYDEPSETLEVEFRNGTIYQYYNVSPGIWEQLQTAPSKGQFINAYLRNAYPYSRVG
jgi:hypothetical protein